MVVHECEPDSADVDDRTQQLGDAHARARRRADVDAMKQKESVASVDHGDMQLLLLSTRQQRRGDRCEIRRRLHAPTSGRPPCRHLRQRSHHLRDARRIRFREAGALQAAVDARLEELLQLAAQRSSESFGEPRSGRKHLDGGEQPVIRIRLPIGRRSRSMLVRRHARLHSPSAVVPPATRRARRYPAPSPETRPLCARRCSARVRAHVEISRPAPRRISRVARPRCWRGRAPRCRRRAARSSREASDGAPRANRVRGREGVGSQRPRPRSQRLRRCSRRRR